jgi:hypothetical protein
MPRRMMMLAEERQPGTAGAPIREQNVARGSPRSDMCAPAGEGVGCYPCLGKLPGDGQSTTFVGARYVTGR